MKTRHITQPLSQSCPAQWSYRFAWAVLSTALVSSALGQSVVIRSQPLRFTIPIGVAGTSLATNTIVTSGLTNVVNFTVTGAPAGVTATFGTNSITVNGTHTAILSITVPSSLAAGTYDLAVEATGDASFRLPVPIICGYIWSGAAYTNGASTNLTTPGNWQGDIAPGSSDDVVFRDMGAVTNAANGASAQQTAPIIATNVIVPSDVTVGSLRFAQETTTNQAFNIEIQSGATLSVTGPNGLTFMRDSKGNFNAFGAKFSGGGRLLVANPTATIKWVMDTQPNPAIWDMRDLNTFEADVVRLALGDFREFPNYFTNGSVGQGTGIANYAARFAPQIYLARTNVIKASYVDPDNYLNPGIRNYALTLGNNEAQGTTSNLRFSLGVSNAFFLDSLCYGQSGAGGSGNLYNFNTTNSYALFRGISGASSRMSVWVQGDPAGTNASGSNVRGVGVDLSNGKVDAMVDRFYLGRYRTNTTGMTIQGTLTLGGAVPGTIFDVNTAFLGYQEAINLGTGASAVSGPTGTLNVNSNATFRINGDLNLGYTTAAATGLPSYAENCAGTLNINNSGTVMASNILAGGVTKLSINNNISINNSGKLIVTNILGANDARINSLTLANNAQITLLGVAVGQTAVYVRTLAAATACNINVPVISGYTSGDVTIPLISYVTASPVISGLSITPPAGLFIKSIVNNGVNSTIDVTFTDRPPLVLIWRGNVNNKWTTNVTDKNWVTQVGGLQTNFLDGDSVIFDDTATGSTSIDIPDPVAPGQTAAAYGMVDNSTNKNYTFASGSAISTVTLRKAGTSTLTINANFTPGVSVSQGSFVGNVSGVVGPSTLEAGTTMTGFFGTINGGLSASNATVAINGTVNGGLNLRAGTLINSGTINGTVTLATNVTLNNTLGAAMNVNVPWSVPTNSTLINNGTIRHSGTPGANQGLTVNGTLVGAGVISSQGTNAIADVRVTMGAGSTWTIGNSAGEVTNTTVAVRLDFLAASTTTFDVDNSTSLNDKILLTEGFNSGKVNFGNGNSLGGTFVINKTAGPAFNLATVLNLFDLVSNVPDNQNQAIPGVFPAPAPGLVWNVSRIVTNLTLGVMGPAFLTNGVSNGTNFVFEWSEAYRGWRLERQTNSLSVGLDWNSTNWVGIANSFGGTNVYYPDTNDLSQFYFRSVQTISQTNAPTVFYRLTYP